MYPVQKTQGELFMAYVMHIQVLTIGVYGWYIELPVLAIIFVIFKRVKIYKVINIINLAVLSLLLYWSLYVYYSCMLYRF